MKTGARRVTIAAVCALIISATGAGVIAQDEDTQQPTSTILTGYFASFGEDGVDLEVPEFAVTFPDGGEAVIRGLFTLTGNYDGLDDGAEVTISGTGWEVRGMIFVNSPLTPEELTEG
jgi:hypothetical protein